MNRASREDTRRSHAERVLRVMVHIQSNLGEDLTLERLAGLAHLSAFHFHRVFAAAAGEGPAEFVRRLRLERAARELLGTDKPVGRIAAENGYGHRESFVRAFAARFGVAPAGFRGGRNGLTRRGRRVRGAEGAAFEPSHRAPGVRVDQFPSLHLAFVRRIGGDGVPMAQLPRLVAWAAEKQRATTEDILRLGVIHDDPGVTACDRRRFDACVAVAPSVRAEGDIGVQVIGGGEFGVVTHRGPYAGLARARLGAAKRCVRALKRRLRAGALIEVYLNDPARTAARRLVTDILVPVETVRATKRWYFRRARPG